MKNKYYWIIKKSKLFNKSFYLLHNIDVKRSGINPLKHFIKYGWKEGRNPNALFDVQYYLKNNPDIVISEINPLVHYIKYGWKEGRNPSLLFDVKYYLESNPDVKKIGVEPLFHYLKYGYHEGRNPNSLYDVKKYLDTNKKIITSNELTQNSNINNDTIIDDLEQDVLDIRKSNTFNGELYVQRYPDLIDSGFDPIKHYVYHGCIEGRIAPKGFDAAAYCKKRKINYVEIWNDKRNNEYDIKISVIIPTYNRAQMLNELINCWRKIYKSTKYSFEIIFSDDGSTDDSIKILKEVNDLPIIVLENEHKGPANARNVAIRHARGEKLYIVGDDILPNENILNQHYEKLMELPVTDAVLGKVDWDQKLQINYLMEHITNVGNEQFGFNRFKPNCYYDFRHFYTCNISIDREFLLSEQVIFDERFYKVNFEDIELGYRLAKKGLQILYYPDASCFHYHPYIFSKFTNRQKTAGEMATVFFNIHGQETNWFLEIDQIIDKYKDFKENVDYSTCSDFGTDLIKLIMNLLSCFDNYVNYSNYIAINDLLSVLYKAIFRYYYEIGILNQFFSMSEEDNNAYFMYHFWNNHLNKATKKLLDGIKLNKSFPVELIDDIINKYNNLSHRKENLSLKKKECLYGFYVKMKKILIR